MSRLITSIEKNDVSLLDYVEIGLALGSADVAVNPVVITVQREMFGSHPVEFEEWVVAVSQLVVDWVGLVACSLVGGGGGSHSYLGADGGEPVLIAFAGLWYFVRDCFGELLEYEGFGFEAVASDEKDLGGEC